MCGWGGPEVSCVKILDTKCRSFTKRPSSPSALPDRRWAPRASPPRRAPPSAGRAPCNRWSNAGGRGRDGARCSRRRRRGHPHSPRPALHSAYSSGVMSPALSESAMPFHARSAASSLEASSDFASNPSTSAPSTYMDSRPNSSESLKSSSRACLAESTGTSLSASGEILSAPATARTLPRGPVTELTTPLGVSFLEAKCRFARSLRDL